MYQCNDCTGPFTNLQSLRDNMWSRRLSRVVKRKCCETYWILLGRLMMTHVSFEVTVPSTLIITNWAAQSSFTSVNMLIHTGERPFIIPCPVPEPDNCFALFYFVLRPNACISHVVITLIRYFLIPKSRDLVSHNPGISALKNGPVSRYPGIPGLQSPFVGFRRISIVRISESTFRCFTNMSCQRLKINYSMAMTLKVNK